MDTPRATSRTGGAKPRHYTQEEKEHILANFDLEVADRVSKFERYIEQVLEAFLVRHETEVTRVPKGLRTMPVGEFMDKYNGSIKEALEGLTKARMAQGDLEETVRKRKLNTSTQDEPEPSSSRPIKSAKIAPQSPSKPAGLFSAARRQVSNPSRVGKTPTTATRIGVKPRFPQSPGPSKLRPPSPSKSTASILPPSRAQFNPSLPAKTPTFPRRLRKNELVISANGSPLTNPLDETFFGTYRIPKTVDEGDEGPPSMFGVGGGGLRDIVVRRDPSYRPSTLSDSTHSTITDSTLASSRPSTTASNSFVVSVPTNRGHLIEFDALQHSPGALDRLPGVTDSAKKGAKEEMIRMVQTALDKWTLS